MKKNSANILVVDDEQEVLLTLQALFSSKGYHMLTAQEANVAYGILKEKTPCLVLLDMKMPGIDGIQVLKHIKENYPGTKVVIITTYDAEYREKAEQIGFDAFLSKPLSMRVLTNTIEAALAGKKQPSAPEGVEKLMKSKKVLAKAKVLFFDLNEAMYAGKVVYFSKPSQCGGKYTCDAAFTKEAFLKKLVSFKPDIVAGDTSQFSFNKDTFPQAMNCPNPPKDIILYGYSHASGDASEHDKAKFVEGSFDPITSIFNREYLYKLGLRIRQAAIEYGLYESSDKAEWDPTPPKGKGISEVPPVEELEQKAIETIANEIGIPVKDVTLNSHLMNDLGVDSMDLIEITMALEDVFQIEIDDTKAKKLLRVKDIIKYIKTNAYN